MDSLPKKFDVARCPLCGQANDCQLCTSAAYKGPCWCMQVKIPDELLAQIPEAARNKACLCRDCVMQFHRSRNATTSPVKILPGDFYFENSLMVFTAAYLLRRGYCCGSNCRHCPYAEAARII